MPRAGEVVLLRMQFHEAPGAKVRPELALLDSVDEGFIAAPITSRFRSTEYDLQIVEWQAAGLNVPSWVRVHKLTVLAKAEVVKTIGLLTTVDRKAVESVMCRIFCPDRSGS